MNKDISSIYMGMNDGFILSYDDRSDQKPLDIHTFDYFSSEWYKLVEEKQDVCFTDVYEDIFGRGLVITCAGPLHDSSGKFCGVLGMDFLINDLYSEITDIRLGDSASMFVVGVEGKVISLDPDKNNRDAEAAGFNIAGSDKERISSFSDGIVAHDGHYYAFDTIDTVGWKLCVSVPQSQVQELASAISDNIIFSIILFLIFFAVILTALIIVVYQASKKITDPITTLTKDIAEMSSGNLAYRAKVQGSEEISALGNRFNEMADSLQKYIKGMTAMIAEKERLGAELNVATKIQADMLPKNFPEHRRFSLYASMDPAKEVGGDFYDFFMIDDDHLGLVMADVSGKGIPAALFMVIAKTLLKVRTTTHDTPAQMLYDVNNTMCENNDTGLFVTIWFGILTLSTGELTYSNAGHEYPALRRANGDYELIEEDHCPPIATMEDIEYENRSLTLRKGDGLFLYTDGVPEAKAADGSRFGTDRMLEILNRNKDLPVDKMLLNLKKDIDEFAGEGDPFDDITMMGIIWTGK